jgi:hypothetical protein
MRSVGLNLRSSSRANQPRQFRNIQESPLFSRIGLYRVRTATFKHVFFASFAQF